MSFVSGLAEQISSLGDNVEAVFNVFEKVVQMTQTFGPHEWAVVSVLTVVLGYMCLKGMNIR